MKKIATILFILFQLVTYAQEVVYTKIEDKDITEIPPVFPGCEEIAHSQKMNCFQKKINEHIVQNFNYPKEALRGGFAPKKITRGWLNDLDRILKNPGTGK